MKRFSVFGIIFLLLLIIAGFQCTAMNPEIFAGQWYSAEDQSAYLFQEGLIYSSKHSVNISNEESISGAYAFSKDSILLFAAGIDGLETEKELYFVSNRDESFLCDRRDGSGKVYFIRYRP